MLSQPEEVVFLRERIFELPLERFRLELVEATLDRLARREVDPETAADAVAKRMGL